MGAKQIICAIFYVIFSLIFTALLVCAATGMLNIFGVMANDFFTTTIYQNVITPFHTAIDSLGIMDSVLAMRILYILVAVVVVALWVICVTNLANILRSTSTKATSISSLIFSIIMFVLVDVSLVLIVYGGEDISTVLSNYYLVGQAVLYLLLLIISILSLTIQPKAEDNKEETESTPPTPLTPLQKEDRIKQILGDDYDPRV